MTFDRPSVSPKRATWFGIIAVLTLSAVGFLGETARPSPAPWRPPPAGSAVNAAVPRARSYSELGEVRRGPNGAMYGNAFVALRAAPDPIDSRLVPPAERIATVEERSRRRAYAGAPPVIPHAIAQRELNDCVSCHAYGVRIAGRTAPLPSHELYTNCVQCHAVAPEFESAQVPDPKLSPEAGPSKVNEFAGLQSYGLGTRAWPGAPPTIPHPTQMSSQCTSCHGPQGPNGLRTPHPDRQSCLQCHARREPADSPPAL
ncbi:MAG TPA: nitrate reductase cytochrome c-type subunit [Polyangiaceae bacterium]|nr:nitrate reductase cytochrome c-type subunit [Polyangiaceae bacterium]